MKKSNRIADMAIIPALLALILLVSSPNPASADTTNWTGTTGDWHDPLNWDNGIPTSDDDTYIDNGGTAQISADAESYYLYAGYNNSGAVEQTGGTHSATYLYLGYYYGSSGTYNLSAGELSVGFSEYIGRYGVGEFNQTGGTNTVRYLYVNDNSSYTLSSGTLSISNSAEVNGFFHFTNGDWALNVNGGLVNFTNATIDGAGSSSFTSAANSLTIFPAGFDPAVEFGSYNALGLVHTAGSTLVIPAGEGFAGLGYIDDSVECQGTIVACDFPLSFIQGPIVFNGNILISNGGTIDEQSYSLTVDNGMNATIAASGGQLFARSEYIGYYGTGEFIQDGGTNTADSYLYLGYESGSSGTYNLGGTAKITVDGNEFVGYKGTGEFNQTGGTHTVDNYLYLGYESGSSGTCNLSGGYLHVGDREYIGDYGTGEFNQTGGTHRVDDELYLGYSSGSSGTYNLSAGELYAGSEYIGYEGAGEFNQTGGINTVGYLCVKGDSSYTLSSGTLSISDSAEVNGSFHLTDGDWTLNINEGVANFENAVFSDASAASFSSAAGTLTIFPTGFDPAAEFGSYNASGLVHNAGSTLVISAGEGFAGHGWIGDYVQNRGNIVASSGSTEFSSGSLEFRGGLTLSDGGTLDSSKYNFAVDNGATVTIAVSGGELSALDEHIGRYGTSEFNQNGGTHTVNHYLRLGYESGSSGTYNLSAGELSVGSSEYIGRRYGTGTGEFNQTGGTNTVGYLFVKDNSSYSLSGGTLSIGDNAEINGSFHFNNGDGALNVNGGLVNFADAVIDGAGSASFTSAVNSLTIFPTGFDPAVEFGSYNALGLVHTAGSTLVISAGEGFAGRGWIGDYVQNSGNIVASNGSLDFRGGLTISDGGTLDFGIYYLTVENGTAVTIAASGGVLSARHENIGYSGTGEFNQDGGTNTVSDNLRLGYESGSSGTYNLSAGELSVGPSGLSCEYIGYNGTGEFNQSGGIHTVSGNLSLGYGSGSSGTYNLSAGGLSVGSSEFIGLYGTGEFNQDGGTHTVGLTLYLGRYSGPSGTYSLSGGVLSARYEYIGLDDTGEFNQTGGIHTVSNYLRLGSDYGSSGTYNLSAGELSVGSSEYIGDDGTGEFNQTGGTNTVSVNLRLGFASGSSGTYNLSGGTMEIGGHLSVGYLGSGEFVQSGGTHSVSSSLSIGFEPGSSGTYNLSGGSLETGDLVIGSNGTFNVTNSTASITVNGSMTLEEGAILSAVPGTTIHMTGSIFDNQSTSSSEMSGLWETTFIFEGGTEDIDTFEIAGMDYGEDGIGFSDNFALGGLILGGVDVGYVQLVDKYVNFTGLGPCSPEALYVRSLTINSGSTLDLNGYHIYTLEYIDNGGTVLNGEINVIPEPATIALISAGLLGLAGLARKKCRSIEV